MSAQGDNVSFDIGVTIEEKPTKQQDTGALGDPANVPALPKAFLKQLEKEMLTRIQKKSGDKIRAASGLLSEQGAPVQRNVFKDLQKQVQNTQKSVTALENVFSNHIPDLIQGASILQNPQGFVGQQVLGLLGKAGPHGAAIVAAITSIAASPEVAKQIIKLLAQKGGPLNEDWRRSVEEEVNGLFNVEEKKRRLLGIDNYIVTQTDRYEPDSGSTTFNSYENKDEVIISKIGLADKAVGIDN